jgi:hypothetical protein
MSLNTKLLTFGSILAIAQPAQSQENMQSMSRIYTEAIQKGQIKSVKNVHIYEWRDEIAKYGFVEVRNSDYYRIQSTGGGETPDFVECLRPEAKLILEQITEKVARKVKEQTGLDFKFRVVGMTDDNNYSNSLVRANDVGLGFEISNKSIEVFVDGRWQKTYQRKDVVALAVKMLLDESSKMRNVLAVSVGDVVSFSIMPKGQILPSKFTTKTPEGKPVEIIIPPIKRVPPAVYTPNVQTKIEPVKTEVVDSERLKIAEDLKKYLITKKIDINIQTKHKGYGLSVDDKLYAEALILTYRQLSDVNNKLPNGGIAEIEKRISFCKSKI